MRSQEIPKPAEKKRGRPRKVEPVNPDPWDIPARMDIDPENPVVCAIYFADGQVRNLDCLDADAGGEKLHIVRRRGMVSSKITIPLVHIRMWEKRQLMEPQELLLPPTKEVVSPIPQVEPSGGYYAPDKEAARKAFIRDARKNQQDYVKGDETAPVVEMAKPLMGDDLLSKAQGKA